MTSHGHVQESVSANGGSSSDMSTSVDRDQSSYGISYTYIYIRSVLDFLNNNFYVKNIDHVIFNFFFTYYDKIFQKHKSCKFLDYREICA